MPKLCYGSPFPELPADPKSGEGWITYEDIVEDIFESAANASSSSSCVRNPDLVRFARRVWWFMTKMDIHPDEFSDKFKQNVTILGLAKERPGDRGGFIYQGFDYE